MFNLRIGSKCSLRRVDLARHLDSNVYLRGKGVFMQRAACAMLVILASSRVAVLPPKLCGAGEPPLPGGIEGRQRWQEEKCCGANVLYLFLRLHGVAASHAELLREVPVGENGTSLEDLRRIARQHGLEVEVVRATPKSLSSVRFPAIAHEEVERGRGTTYSCASSMTRRPSSWGLMGLPAPLRKRVSLSFSQSGAVTSLWRRRGPRLRRCCFGSSAQHSSDQCSC